MDSVMAASVGGVVLLGAVWLARFTGVPSQAGAALYFVPLWLLAVISNTLCGEADSWSIREGLLVFALPASLALWLWQQLRR